MTQITESGAPKAVIREMRASMERQFAAAEARAARLGRGEPALQAARQRLLDGLRRQPPATARSCATSRLTSSCSSPTPTGRARGGGRRRLRPAGHGAAGPNPTGRRPASTSAGRRGDRTLPEQIAHRSQQAEAALAHFWSHFPKARRLPARSGRWRSSSPGSPTRSRKPGFRVRSRLIDEARGRRRGEAGDRVRPRDHARAPRHGRRTVACGSPTQRRSGVAMHRKPDGWGPTCRRACAHRRSWLAITHPEGDQGYRPAVRRPAGGGPPAGGDATTTAKGRRRGRPGRPAASGPASTVVRRPRRPAPPRFRRAPSRRSGWAATAARSICWRRIRPAWRPGGRSTA